MTYNEALATLPADANWSCSFGYPGDDNYREMYRDKSGTRYEVLRKWNTDHTGWTIRTMAAA